MGFRSRENHGNFSWAPDVWVFAGEAPCGVRSQKSGVTRGSGQMSALGSVRLVIGLGSVTVAARVGAFVCPVTMRSVIVIITNPAAPPQSVKDQTSRPNS